MTPGERSWSEHIRDLIDEFDRVRGESERLRGYAERAIQDQFWPDRRRSSRVPGNETARHEHWNDL